MTMVPAQNLSKQHIFAPSHGSCGVGLSENFRGHMSCLQGYECCTSEACLGSSDFVVGDRMAEDDSRTNSLNEAGSSSNNNKDVQEAERDEGWLQLSIGGHHTIASTSHAQDDQLKFDPTDGRRRGLIELDLLPTGGTNSHQQLMRPIFHVPHHEFQVPPPMAMAANSFNPSLFLQQHPGTSSSTLNPHAQEINWAFRPMPQNITTASSFSSSLMPLGSYFSRPYQLQSSGGSIAGPSSDVRVIDAPRRPHSGIWFMLQASQNQAKEPFLPQIPKSYLRIKDGSMTVRLLMKYLVSKLRLDSESEIEITCRGQQLLPFLTLQHVRDNIWSPRDAVTLLSDSSTTDHVMVLHYGRSA